MSTKHERVEHANALIKVIAAHGRRFFYSKQKERTAHMAIDARGRVWFIDDYTGVPIYVNKTGSTSKWNCFSHGGTMRALIERMRDYILKGEQIPRWQIAIPQMGGKGNIWGYDDEAAAAVRAAAFELPIMEDQKESA